METPSEPQNSVDVIFNLAKGRIDEQNSRIGTLDTKANFGVVSSTVLISGATGLRTALATAQKDPKLSQVSFLGTDALTAVNALTIAALVTFAVLVFCAFMAYQLRDYTVVPNLNTLLELRNFPPEQTKIFVTQAWTEALYENESLLLKKVRWARAVLGLLVVQGGWLIAMAFAQATLTA